MSRKSKHKHIKHRIEIFKRDNFSCLNCGSDKELTVDHIKPKAKGGTNKFQNLQTLCKTCNSVKGNFYINFLNGDMTGGVLPTMGHAQAINKLKGIKEIKDEP